MKEYEIYHKDERIMTVQIDDDSFNIIRYTNNKFKTPFFTDTRNAFYEFLKSRCYENNRADLKKILESVGMKDNNPYEWIKITHGLKYEDFFWIKESSENITYEDIKIR